MTLRLIKLFSRFAVIEIDDGGNYFLKTSAEISITGKQKFSTDKSVIYIDGLVPDTEYTAEVRQGESAETIFFRTQTEFVTFNVKDFGAKGDGVSDDTVFIQCAVSACPKQGRVLIPAGVYKVSSLFLKSNVSIELAQGSVLSATVSRDGIPILPGLVESFDETDEFNLGTWEGNPLKAFSSVITAIDCENIAIYGSGKITGNASHKNWWKDEKKMVGAFRPRLLFLERCKNAFMAGIMLENSPSWTVHPYFSESLGFYSITIENPANSPNTDGLNPESCKNVEIIGCRFTLGDDCIALKSGKIYMGRKHKTPTENVIISRSLMENGHGAITIGSEMAGGIRHITAENCLFRNTDRGLRIKTRRGRGKQAVVDEICFKNIVMENVKTPLVANCFYFCDPDGRTDFVQNKGFVHADDGTPEIKKLDFYGISCYNCHVAAAFFIGLPESKIGEIRLRNFKATFAAEPKEDYPAMLCGIEPCSRLGIFAENVNKLSLENVEISGFGGEMLVTNNVDELSEV